MAAGSIRPRVPRLRRGLVPGPTAPHYLCATSESRDERSGDRSLILGIVWVFGLGAILAFIFGIVALRQIDRNPRQGGRGLAAGGIVLGSIGIVGLVLFITLAVAAHNNCVQYGNCS